MGDWPNTPGQWGAQAVTISTAGKLSLGPVARYLVGTQPASTAFPASNRAILVPVRVPVPVVVYQMIIGSGTTATGNFDAGIYDLSGNLIVSSGATAKGNGVETVVNITDTQLGSGTYYMALAADGTNNYVAWAPANAGLVKAVGVRQASSAYTLPATITMETAASAFYPSMAMVVISQ